MRRWLPRDQSPALSGRPTGRPRCWPGSISDLLGAAAGIRNLILITGDPPTEGPYADAEAIFDIDAIGLPNVEAGADFVVTQPVFDPEAFARFLERA